jgi:maleate isomerase
LRADLRGAAAAPPPGKGRTTIVGTGLGSRARIGQLYPSGGLCDHEIQRMAPAGVHFVTTRMPFRRAGLEDDAALARDVEFHAALLADARVDLIAFNCTAASMVTGPAAINRRIEAATGIGSVTTIEAVLESLSATAMKRVALLTPYLPEVVAAEVAFLAERGVRVDASAGLPCAGPVEQGCIEPQRWLALARALRDAPVDGLLISCAGIQVADVLADIEAAFGRPVVASNQALLWACLRRLGIAERPRGFGALLEGAFDGS